MAGELAAREAGEGERPQWASPGAQIVVIEQGGVTYKVPPSVKQRLDAPLSAVPGSTSPKVIFESFNITPKYVPPNDPTVVPDVQCVKVGFVGKDDASIKHEWSSAAINASKLLEKLIKSDKVSDETKVLSVKV